MKQKIVFLGLLLFVFYKTNAQDIILDKIVRGGEVTLFQSISNPNDYYYIPDKIQLGKHSDGTPQFSFTKYAKNSAPTGTNSTGFSETNDAGGILHALVMIKVPDDQVKNAQRELQRVNPNGKVIGPIVFKSGKVALISSIIGSDGQLTKKVVGIGNAPILEGSKAAVSVLLTKQGADLLWATFQGSTPDLSFQFEMDVKGYQSPKRVLIEADFEQIYAHRSFEAAVVSPVLAIEVKNAFEDLANKGAIKVTQVGEDADLNKMKETAYNQLVNLMFDKVGGQGIGDLGQLGLNQQQSMLDRATNMLNTARREAREENARQERNEMEREEQMYRRARENARSRMDSIYQAMGYRDNPFAGSHNPNGRNATNQREAVPNLAVAASFVMKNVRRTGKYTIDLNKYTEETKTFPFSENVGNIAQTCKSCFLAINIDDPLYKQRDIQVRLIGIDNKDFEGYLSNVEVLMKKTHESGDISYGSVIVDKAIFNEKGNNFSIQYGWKNDNTRNKWLNYEYKTKWVFNNGATVETDWKKDVNGIISLIPPLVKREISIEIDPDLISQENIRAAEIKLFAKNGDNEEVKTINFKVSDQILSKSTEIILPKSMTDYDYETTWFIKGKDPFKQTRKTTKFNSIYFEKL